MILQSRKPNEKPLRRRMQSELPLAAVAHGVRLHWMGRLNP